MVIPKVALEQLRSGIDAVKDRAELLLISYGSGKGAPYVDISCTRYCGVLPKVHALAQTAGLEAISLEQGGKLDMAAFRKLWKTAHWLMRNLED